MLYFAFIQRQTNQENALSSSTDPANLRAAIKTADSDVEPPGRTQPASLTSALKAMAVGDLHGHIRQVPASLTADDVIASLPDYLERHRGSVSSCTRRAKAALDKQTGGQTEFSVELSLIFSTRFGPYTQALIKRVA